MFFVEKPYSQTEVEFQQFTGYSYMNFGRLYFFRVKIAKFFITHSFVDIKNDGLGIWPLLLASVHATLVYTVARFL